MGTVELVRRTGIMKILVLLTLSMTMVHGSRLAVAPPTGYLPSVQEEYDEDLPGYSDGTFSLPGYSDSDLTRSGGGEELEEISTTVRIITTTQLEGDFTTSGDSNTEGSTETERKEDTTSVPTGEDTDSTGDPGGESSAFSMYSNLSPNIRQCPGSSVEACVSVCPGVSPRVYGACVQGCADRCPGSEV